MAKRSNLDHMTLLVTVALLGWVIPGAGHLFIKERKRAIIIFATITITYVTGLYAGSIGVIDPAFSWAWYIPQMMATPLTAFLAHIASTNGIESFGNPRDIGQIYTSIAGMLNLLCIISAVYMAHSGRGEIIGHEEDDSKYL
ncbi:MAG TPA: hypothetical protein ENH94_01510 [Phycisphaerales bacterium]|nr:hypothetical protein [Phycisphaerales bacterium]